jgi:hypothetical protein
MRELVNEPAFVEIEEALKQSAASILSSRTTILLLAPPTIEGALAIAPIEGALLDSGIPYRRRFSNEEPSLDSFVWISDQVPMPKMEKSANSPRVIISPIVVDGLRGHLGDPRKGPLTTALQAHALAQLIAPASPRLRSMRPWALSGNWIGSALDTVYDPVFTAIRDFLEVEGSIRVVPVTEVSEPEEKNYPWLDPGVLNVVSENWPSMNIGEREQSMALLAHPTLLTNHPSTPRIEELLWHCIVGNGWASDLATNIAHASLIWERTSQRGAAGRVVDTLLAGTKFWLLES